MDAKAAKQAAVSRQGRAYRVGTFTHGKRQPMAYLRYYNPAWEGCIEYVVVAESGAAAKKEAIRLRAEADKQDKESKE